MERTVNPREEDPAIQRLGGADAAISTAVFPQASEQAIGSLARGGKLVCVGLPAENGMRVSPVSTPAQNGRAGAAAVV